jgi:hypothetical protein
MADNETVQTDTRESTFAFRFRDAYRTTTAKRAELDPSTFSSLAVDMGLAVNTVLAAYPRIQELKAELADLPVDHEAIDELDSYAHAAGHALALYNAATAPPERLDEVYEVALSRRNVLKSDATNLMAHGLLGKDALVKLNNDVGYRNVGYDVMTLVSILRAEAARIAGRSATLPTDLDSAEAVANELLELAALREARNVVDPNVAENRHRAFTLMERTYDQVRRAMGFLRWSRGDMDKITPALYGTKGFRRREEAQPEGSAAAVPATGIGAPGNAVNPPLTATVVPGGQGGVPFV